MSVREQHTCKRECLVIERGQLVAGRYRLLESVGSGAMGVVWQAKDERLERIVAIKQLLVRQGLSESKADDARRRAMREARIAARLQHRNAIALFDVAEHDGNPFLVMEFLAARSLSAVIAERGPLPPEEVAEIGAQVASALAAAHAAGIVHRDVKPGNILLSDTGTVKITDFGISRALDDSTVTQTGMLAGTPAYLAPEVARGQQPGTSSDVFSLGATLYHAIEGAPPFGTNTNPLALLHAVASGNVPRPQRGGALTPTLMSLLHTEPGSRPTMAQAATTLTAPVAQPSQPEEQRTRSVRQASPQPPSRSPQPKPVRGSRAALKSNRVTLVAAIVGVAVLAGIVTAIVLTPSGGGAPGAQGTSPTVSQSPTTSNPPSRSSATPVPVQGPINYRQAGQLVIDYYNGLTDLPAAWQMLSGNMHASFGNQTAFEQHWGQFKRISARNAYGLTTNEDGSVNVPVDVTYTNPDGTERPEHKVLRVIVDNGKLVIDTEAK